MPEISHKQVFGTAGPASTISLGAYSALPLYFGSLQVSALAIILENSNYDILIGTSFLVKYKIDLNFVRNIFNILGQEIPMYYTNDQIEEPKRQKVRSINIIYKNGILPITIPFLTANI